MPTCSTLTAIEIEDDLQMLRSRLGIDEDALRLMHCVHLWIECGLKANLTLKQIATAIVRLVYCWFTHLALKSHGFYFTISFML